MPPSRDNDSRAPIVAKGAGVKRNRSGRITRTKILDAAEQLFAEKGILGASLREIMIAADVNIAAVNYYFGSKADLVRAVVQRRSAVINGARMALLQDAYAKGGGTPTIDDWLTAFITPFVDAEGSDDPGWRNFMRVLNWVATTQAPDIPCQQIVHETYGAMRQNFMKALSEVLPELSPEDVAWRYQCAIAVLRACVIARDRTPSPTRGPIDVTDPKQMIEHIRPFLKGGLMAPPSGSNSRR